MPIFYKEEEEEKISLDNPDKQLYTSEIIKDKETVKKLESLLSKFESCHLIYRASKDGFKGKDFHRLCD